MPFIKQAGDLLYLVESFCSIQGEGKFSGKFAFFFRFAGCNLKCRDFGREVKSPKTGEMLLGCDTIEAVYTKHFSYTKIINSQELLNILPNFKTKPIIIITGGEPLIHHQNLIFHEFISKLIELGFEVHFETNGTIFIDFDSYKIYKKCIFCISPKLSNSGETKRKRLKFNTLNNIKLNAKDSFYKFVICDKFDAKSEIDEILSKCDNEVYCMPLGKNQKELEANAIFTVDFCLQNGYNYSDRLHIRIWDDKGGV